MMIAHPPDASQRRSAVTVFDRNVVVVAGAGTGKTALLTARALVYLLGESYVRSHDRSPAHRAREVVALTFTDKAAAEMAERLVRFLDELRDADSLEALSDQVRALVAEPLIEVYGLTLERIRDRASSMLEYVELIETSTIHGFCSSLLRQHPFETGVSPDFEIDEEHSAFDEILEQVWIDHVRTELSDPSSIPPAWRTAFDAGVGLSLLREFARALTLSSLPTEVILDPVQFVGDPDAHARRLRSARHTLAELAQTIKECGMPAGTRLARLGSVLPDVVHALAERMPLPGDVEQVWIRVGTTAVDDLFPPTVVGKLEQAGIAVEDMKRRVAEAIDTVEEARLFTPVALEAVRSICAPLVQKARSVAWKQGVVAFNHLLLHAVSLLRNHPAIAQALRTRYQCVLLDEVQDTDPLQYDIIKPFRGTTGLPSWGNEGSFIVGDPKQSIYLFRDADIEAFYRESTGLERTGISVVVSANFRSDPRIVSFVNALCRRIFGDGDVPAHVQPPYDPILAHLPATTPHPPVEVIRFAGDDGLLVDDRAYCEHEVIVSRLLTLRAQGFAWSDIAVLVPTRNGLENLYALMQVADIPVVQSRGKSFYARQEVIDTVHLFACLDDPCDKASLFAFLASPVGGLDNDCLVALAEAGLGERFTYLDVTASTPPDDHRCLAGVREGDRAQVAGLLLDLARLHRYLREHQTWDAFREVRRSLPVVEAWASSMFASQRMANVDKVMDEMESRVRAGSTLAAVIKDMAQRELVEREGEEGALASPRLDAVTVETIHGAKGLEYPVVFLANLFREPQALSEREIWIGRDWQTGVVAAKVGPLRNHAARRVFRSLMAKREAERARLMYVALTRAKQRIVLLLHPSAPRRSYSALLERALDDAMLAEELIVGREIIESHATSEPHAPLAPHPPVGYPEEAVARLHLRRKAMETLTLSPIRVTPSSADEPYPRRVLPAHEQEEHPEQRDRALRFGDLCHAALQHLDLTRPFEDVGTVLDSPLARRVAGEMYDELVQEARAVLQAAVHASFFRETICMADLVLREMPVLERIGTATLSGRIDCVVRAGTKWTVIDFKTDQGIAAPEELHARYGAQREAYTRALCRALDLSERPRFFLYFLRQCVAVEL